MTMAIITTTTATPTVTGIITTNWASFGLIRAPGQGAFFIAINNWVQNRQLGP